ncbi:MAG: hypothetical protein Q9167_002134 [Letrouitia subvulpina]
MHEDGLYATQQRLAKFKRTHLQLQQLWQRNGPSSIDQSVAESLRLHLQGLNRILGDEAQRPAPHVCFQNAAVDKLYLLAASIGSSPNNEETTAEAIRFFDLLIENEEGDFVANGGFADRLISFVQAAPATAALNAETEAELIELLFGVAAKLRQRHEILEVWFRPSPYSYRDDRQEAANLSAARSNELPLIYLLLDYVRHEGRVGDFARTGLLYMIELASHSESLEKWIIESELATMMASGLGALYSQLSSKVVLSFSKEAMPPILAFSASPRSGAPADAETIDSPSFQSHLRTFQSYLIFWQDVLEQCASSEIRQTLLDHMDFLFLRPVLYPSLVESSDIDGGSAVATLTYLRCVLETWTHPDLVRHTLQYMLGRPIDAPADSKSSRPTTLARRRKSESLILNHAKHSEEPSPDLLTLAGIITGYLQSQNQQTVTASLRLTSTILYTHHEHAISTLLKVQFTKKDLRTIKAQTSAIDYLLSLAEDVVENDNLEESFQKHVNDSRIMIEAHQCSKEMLGLPSADGLLTNINPYEQSADNEKWAKYHLVDLDGGLLKSLLFLLEDFLLNDIQTNLSLTQNFSTLAACGYVQLAPWLLARSSENVSDDSDETSIQSDQPHVPLQESSQSNPNKMSQEHQRENPEVFMSPTFSFLESLVKQAEQLREDVQDFDARLAELRHVFKVGEEMDNALVETPILKRTSEDAKGISPYRSSNLPPTSSISKRLRPSTDVSRSNSPRGRKENHLHSSSPFAGRLSHLRLSPSRSPSSVRERTYSTSPLREDSLSSAGSRFVQPKTQEPPNALEQKIKLRSCRKKYSGLLEFGSGSETSSLQSEAVGPAKGFKDVSLSLVLTNVILLQEFLLELAAIMQVRGNLFGEILFD